MKKILILFLLLLTLTACGPVVNQFEPAFRETLGPILTQPVSSPTDIPAAQIESATSAPVADSTPDIFSALKTPACSGVTPENQEGPYYTPNTPERNSLFEESMQGDKLILIGYVLDANCQPISNVWLDFWQANAKGEYDNTGYTLRGHQFTDQQGRYYLETIMPGLYESRPIEHIHVKLQAPDGALMTTQLYFPTQPMDSLTVELTKMEDHYLALFNFVLP